MKLQEMCSSLSSRSRVLSHVNDKLKLARRKLQLDISTVTYLKWNAKISSPALTVICHGDWSCPARHMDRQFLPIEAINHAGKKCHFKLRFLLVPFRFVGYFVFQGENDLFT